MWELRSPSSWTLTFDRALIWSLVVVAETVRVGEAPLSTHSHRFIYGPLHFWLWWLQYLSSYLNCIFKDFIQYLHAIQYELSLFCLPTICFLFNCLLFWHVVAIIHKHACQICFRHKMLGMFPVKICFFVLYHDSDDSWTPRSTCLGGRVKNKWNKTAGWAKLYHPLLRVQITGPQGGTWGVRTLVQQKKNGLFFCRVQFGFSARS